MGKQPKKLNDSMITDSTSFKKLSMISEWRELTVEERIDKAMSTLGIDEQWRGAVARGANHIPVARFAVLVNEAEERAKTSKPRYFIASIRNELAA